jgi:hypothetical protein
MGKAQWVWARNAAPETPPDDERAAIIAACGKFVAEVLKPRFLSQIQPTECNLLYGKWRGRRYSFIQRFRSDCPDAVVPEFEHAFARLDYLAQDLFNVMWHRHTGQWYRLYRSVSLMEALRCIEQDGRLHPL